MVVTHMEWKAMVSLLAALLALKRTDARGADDAQTLLGGLSRWAVHQGAHRLPLTKLPAVPPPISSRTAAPCATSSRSLP
jgi:hypothetical protein